MSLGALLGSSCAAQTPRTTPTAAPASPAPAPPIEAYIHGSWESLSRSMTDCHSLVDPKLTTRPVLYVPAELSFPPQVTALQAACGVRAEHLPRRIDHPGALMPARIATPGLLYLPNRYVVPGGRFNEMYGWDSYFILLGLLEDERRDLARGMVENFFFEIEHYGSVLNANRTYFLTRSQPPLLSSMIRAVYDADTAATPQDVRRANAWLGKAYGYAVRDHALWLTPEHRAGETGLARYHDLGEGPVPEMEDASTYFPDIIRWLLQHPEVKTDYLVEGPDLAPDFRSGERTPEIERLVRVSCDPGASAVCARAHVGTHWLSRDFYAGDRAMRESGFDTTFRFGAFSGSTHHVAPVCLNALLYKYEQDLAWMAAKLGKSAEAKTWRGQAEARRRAMNRYLWNAAAGLYFDYDFVAARQTGYVYITTFYPLWAGAADAAQSAAVAAHTRLFLHRGGAAVSLENSGVQWDLPYGWAPTTWFMVAGLVHAGAMEQARAVAEAFLHTVEAGYQSDGTVREKYDVVNGSAQVQVATGYKVNVIGFGWTNGVYLKLKHLLATPPLAAQGAVQ
ncbi:MAG TPA: trehalase family glycosidase [Acidobacteriaceae bacterium]